jgi:hypothetical protein
LKKSVDLPISKCGFWTGLSTLTPIEYSVPVFAAGSLFWLVAGTIPDELHRFTDRTIGRAVLQDFDSRLRSVLLVAGPVLALLAVGCWLAFLWLAGQWVERIGGTGAARDMRKWMAPAHYLSLFGMAALVFQTPVPAWTPICTVTAVLVVYFIAVAVLCAGTGTSLAFTHTVALAAASIAGGVFRMEYGSLLTYRFAVWSTIGFAILWWSMGGIAKRGRSAALKSWLAIATIPLLFTLAASEIAQELSFVALLRWNKSLPIREIAWWVLAFALLLAAGTLAAAWIGRFRRVRSCSWLLSRVLTPLLLAVAGTLPVLPRLGGLLAPDVHHWGEALMPLDQLLKFGRIPYLDLLPTHGVLANLGPLLHRVIYGTYSVDEFMLGWTIVVVTGMVCAYYFLHRAFASPALAIFLVVFLQPLFYPGLGLAAPYYSVGLIGILAIGRAVRLWTRRAFLEAGIVFFVAGLLRLDIAMAGVLMGTAVFAGAALIRRGRDSWLPLYFAAPLAGPAALWMLILLFSRGGVTKIAASLMLFSLEFHSLSLVPRQFLNPNLNRFASNLFYFAVFPASILAGVLVSIQVFWWVLEGRASGAPAQARNRRADARFLPQAAIAISLTAYNLLIYSRGIQRSNESLTDALPLYTLGFSLVAIILCARILGAGKGTTQWMWVTATLLTISAVPAKNVMFGRAAIEFLTYPVNEVARPVRANEFTARIQLPPETLAAWRALRAYIDREVPPGDTFADLGNEPLLHIAMDRLFPAFNMITLSATGETLQHAYLDTWDVARVPLIVEHGGEPWLNNIDYVPDPVRNYRLHERLHEFYRRQTQVGPYIIYQRRKTTAEAPPVLIAEAATSRELGIATPLVIPTPHLLLQAGFEVVVDFEARCSVQAPFRIDFTSTAATGSGTAFATCGAEGFSPLKEWAVYRLRSPLSVQGAVDSVALAAVKDVPVEVRNVRVTISEKGADLDLAPGLTPFEVGWLPYVWGQYDPLQAAVRNPVVWQSGAGDATLAPHASLTWDVSIPAAPSAYVRVEAESALEASLTFNYAKDAVPLSTAKGFRFSIRAGKSATYLLRPSVQAYWFGDRSPIRKLVLWNNSETRLTIHSIAVLVGD